jgi:pseudaminic acid synthase
LFWSKIIEKHVVLDRFIRGPDAFLSMNEQDFTEMVKAVRETEKARKIIDYTPC